MPILRIKDKETGKWIEVPAIKGDKGESGVHVGETEPVDDSNVWINPTGNPTQTIEYTLTEEDKTEIANKVLEILPTWEGGNY